MLRAREDFRAAQPLVEGYLARTSRARMFGAVKIEETDCAFQIGKVSLCMLPLAGRAANAGPERRMAQDTFTATRAGSYTGVPVRNRAVETVPYTGCHLTLSCCAGAEVTDPADGCGSLSDGAGARPVEACAPRRRAGPLAG